MEISSRQGHQSRFLSGFKVDLRNSFSVFCVVAGLHGGLLFIFLTFEIRSPGRQHPSSAVIEFKLLPPEKNLTHYVPAAPLGSTDIQIHLMMPEFEVQLDAVGNPAIYQLPSTEAKQFDHLFDPRLRKKLQENITPSSVSTFKQYDSFRNAHGATVMASGNGKCMVTMAAGKNERATNWGWSSDSCGKTDSEKMLEAVEEEVNAKKHPPKQ